MATKNKPTPTVLAHTPAPVGAEAPTPTGTKRTGLNYVFAKRATNDHGHFEKGDRGRGSFKADLLDTYVRLGILVPAAKQAPSDG